MNTIPKAFIILAALMIVGTACRKKGDTTDYTHSLNIDGQRHVLDKGLLVNYGPDHTGLAYQGTNMDLNLISSGVQLHFGEGGDVDSASGDGYVLYLQMYSALGNELANGTYVYSKSRGTGTFDVAEIIVIKNGRDQDYYIIDSGSITSRETEGKYGFTGEFTSRSGQEISVSYRGQLSLIDER